MIVVPCAPFDQDIEYGEEPPLTFRYIAPSEPPAQDTSTILALRLRGILLPMVTAPGTVILSMGRSAGNPMELFSFISNQMATTRS